MGKAVKVGSFEDRRRRREEKTVNVNGYKSGRLRVKQSPNVRVIALLVGAYSDIGSAIEAVVRAPGNALQEMVGAKLAISAAQRILRKSKFENRDSKIPS